MYIISKVLEVVISMVSNRLFRGFGATLILTGPPGGGKTSFAKELARQLGATFHYYASGPDKSRDLLYEPDVGGIIRREAAFVKGAAWKAFEDSISGPSVLLIDEVDKTDKGFDSFLLRLLEEWNFTDPEGNTVSADPKNIVVVMTTNGRRELSPEVLRRGQRVEVPLPTGKKHRQIVSSIAGGGLPAGLVDLLCKIGEKLAKEIDPEMAPSPKELALCGIDMVELAKADFDHELIRQIAGSWLSKDGLEGLDKTLKYNWARALYKEAQK